MGLRDNLEQVKSEKLAQEEAVKKTAVMSEQEQSQHEERNFRDAYARKHTLAEATHSFTNAKGETRDALARRKGEFKNITSLMDQLKTEDPSQELPSFKEAIANLESGSDEERYAQSKEEAIAAIAELRKQKETLKALGVDADGLNDSELLQAVQKAQEGADASIREFLLQNPTSELPEALEARKERVAALEQELQRIQTTMEEHTKWGMEHIGKHISSWDRNPEALPDQIRERIERDQEWLDRDKVQLTQASLYKDLLENKGIMADPEVKRTYEAALTANKVVSALEEELGTIKRKPTSMFIGYTEKKKQEEIAEKERVLASKREEAKTTNSAYDAAASTYTERYKKFEDTFKAELRKAGGYEETKKMLETSIQDGTKRIEEAREQLSTATYYSERRRALMNELEEKSQELSSFNGGKRTSI